MRLTGQDFMNDTVDAHDATGRTLTRIAVGIEDVGRQRAAMAPTLGGPGMRTVRNTAAAAELAAKITAWPTIATTDYEMAVAGPIEQH